MELLERDRVGLGWPTFALDPAQMSGPEYRIISNSSGDCDTQIFLCASEALSCLEKEPAEESRVAYCGLS